MSCYDPSTNQVTQDRACLESGLKNCVAPWSTLVRHELFDVPEATGCGRLWRNVCQRDSWPSQSDNNALLQCCMSQNPDFNQCDPSACLASTRCVASLAAYCNDPNTVYNSFCQANVCGSKLDCTNAMQRYCATGDNIISDTCYSLRSTRPDLADPAMIAYCSRNPNAPICGCLTITDDVKEVIAEATAQKINFQIQCNLASCIPDVSYKPASARGQCSEQSICLPTLILQNVSGSKFGNINQTCNQSSDNDTTTTTAAPTDTTTGINISLFGYSFSFTQQQIYLLLGLIFTILVALILLLFGDSPKVVPKVSKLPIFANKIATPL
jgi:hypothetical protein